MPAALLPDSKVRRLVREGLGNAEIVDRLRQEDHIEVTPSAISVFRSRHNLPPAPGRHDDLIPWRVKREHASLWAAKVLRWESRRRSGERLNERAQRRVDAFLQRLKDQDAVVHYEPESAQGFWLVPRRHGVDTDIIRNGDVE
jgi:hypothetical protein